MNNRRKFLIQGTLATTAMMVAKPFKTLAGIGSSIMQDGNTITLLHTNDIVNRLSPLQNGLGGFRQTAATIAQLRSQDPNILLLDAGNAFSGRISEQEIHSDTLAMMQEAGYDAMLPGEHELKASNGFYAEQLSGNSIPVILSDRSVSDSSLRSRVEPYRVIRKGHISIGIIGAGNYASNAYDSINSVATMLKKEKKCDIIVCLSQMGYRPGKTGDVELAAKSEHIDIIIGGNTRSFLHRPVIVLNKLKQEVVINQAGHSGIVLGKMQFTFNQFGEKQRIDFRNLVIGSAGNKWQNNIA